MLTKLCSSDVHIAKTIKILATDFILIKIITLTALNGPNTAISNYKEARAATNAAFETVKNSANELS